MPHVEVVVPCHNYGHFLPRCIESIVNQPGVTKVVTIVDDTSKDDSAEVAERLTQQHTGVRLIRNSTNLGACRTFNVGLEQVDADYLLLISADDILAPGALSRATALMEANPTVGLVYGHTQKFTDAPTVKLAAPAVSWTTWQGDRWIGMQLGRSWSNIASPEAVVRTRVQHEVGYYDPNLPHTADVEMWLRLASASDVGHINGIDQAYYRRQPESHSARFSVYQDIGERWRAYSQFLANWSNRELALRYRPMVQRKLARSALLTLLLQLENSGDTQDVDVQAVLALASDIDPAIDGSELWQDVYSCLENQTHRGALASLRAATRDVARRTQWQRWHRWRYFG